MKKINEKLISGRLIDSCRREGDKLVITYLDSSSHEMQYLPDYEYLVNTKKVLQTECRYDYCNLENIRKNIKLAQEDIILELMKAALSISMAALREELLLRIIFSIITLNAFFNIKSYIKEIKIEKQKLIQLQKYSYFIEIEKYFDENPESSLVLETLFNDFELSFSIISENSLKDVRKLHKKVVRERSKQQ